MVGLMETGPNFSEEPFRIYHLHLESIDSPVIMVIAFQVARFPRGSHRQEAPPQDRSERH
jgi:hypothetical protein